MSARSTPITKAVLSWARQQMGYSTEELAAAMKKEPEVIIAWETEDDQRCPTYRQLEKLAGLLKRPVAVFFFPAPPDEKKPDEEFRMLPQASAAAGVPDTRFAIREARANQMRLVELLRGRNHAGDDFLFSQQKSFSAEEVRTQLQIPLSVQKSWNSTTDALKHWRDALESRGVFVFKRSFKQRSVSGFCLWDAVAPLIVINNSTSFSRQIFTLFHELGHLTHRHNGVTRADPLYLETLAIDERDIEVACNAFAADFLVPQEDFKPHLSEFTGDEQEIVDWAREYSVSREVILRRLRDGGAASQATYNAFVADWARNFYIRGPGDNPGGDYYRTQRAYLSKTYVKLAFSSYHAGESSMTQLAESLGIRARNIASFEDGLR